MQGPSKSNNPPIRLSSCLHLFCHSCIESMMAANN
ncbi:MAG: hypothetical protein ACK56F_25740 [bacterium]